LYRLRVNESQICKALKHENRLKNDSNILKDVSSINDCNGSKAVSDMITKELTSDEKAEKAGEMNE
jgi:hypothetical protein